MKKRNQLNSKEIFATRKSNWIWLRIGILSLMIMMFGFAFSSLAKKSNTQQDIITSQCDLSRVEEQIYFIDKGIDTLNAEKESPSVDLVDAVWELAFSIDTDQSCVSLVNAEKLKGLKSAFGFEKIGIKEKIDLINAKVSILNKAGIGEPIKVLQVSFKEESEVEIVACSTREQNLFDILANEIGENKGTEISGKTVLFLKQLTEELDTNLLIDTDADVLFVEDFIEKMAENSNCKFKVKRDNQKIISSEESSKEYLCDTGEIVKDKLLCPLN